MSKKLDRMGFIASVVETINRLDDHNLYWAETFNNAIYDSIMELVKYSIIDREEATMLNSWRQEKIDEIYKEINNG